MCGALPQAVAFVQIPGIIFKISWSTFGKADISVSCDRNQPRSSKFGGLDAAVGDCGGALFRLSTQTLEGFPRSWTRNTPITAR